MTDAPGTTPRRATPLDRLQIVGRFVRRAVKKPGSAPGTVVHTGRRRQSEIRLGLLDYDETHFEESERATLAQCLTAGDEPAMSWVNVEGLHDVEVIGALGSHFGWHPLVVEDIASTGQRAKLEEHDSFMFIVVPMLSWNPVERQVSEEQISLLVGSNYVMTFQERSGDVFDGVRQRLRAEGTRIRGRGADYLAYALVDALVDHYFQVLEAIGDLTEDLEEEVLTDPTADTMHKLHGLKRELIVVRRAVWPMREVLGTLHRSETHLFTDSTRIFVRDVYDHAVQVMDTVEALRDVASGAVDLYLSSVSFRTNEIMKVLTIMASIFIPLTFLAGVYGMNFEFMPELHVRWAYPAVVVVMVTLAAGLVAYFRKRGWL